MVLQLKHNAMGGQPRHDEHHRWTTGILQEGNVCSGFTKEGICAISTWVESCILVNLQHFLCLWPFLGTHDELFFKTFQIHWPHMVLCCSSSTSKNLRLCCLFVLSMTSYNFPLLKTFLWKKLQATCIDRKNVNLKFLFYESSIIVVCLNCDIFN